MRISLQPQHLKRYQEIAQLFWKYGRSDLVKDFPMGDALSQRTDSMAQKNHAPPDELADDLEAMGPTYVKLGQLLSSRPDLLPEPYRKALTRLQDKVRPFDYEEVEKIVNAELGIRISKAFSEFDRVPLAAASLAQVHRASLRDGRAVVVKVQRPDIGDQIAKDLEVLKEIATLLDRHTKLGKRYQLLNVFEEFQTTIIQELDYRREAANLSALSKSLEDSPHIRVPLPVEGYSTQRVLTMEHVSGCKITELSPLARLDIDGGTLAEELFRAYLKQVLVDGLFHADPHPGNVFLTEDGCIALLDLGMIGRTSPGMQEKLLKLLLAVSDGNSEQAGSIAIQMSETTDDFDEASFRRKISSLVAEQKDNALRDIQIGRTLLDFGRTAGEAGLFVPPELTLLSKTLLQLDEIGRCLDPSFNPNLSIRRNAADIMKQRMRRDLTPSKALASLLEMKEFFGNLPFRLNRMFDAIENSEFEVRIKTTDANLLLDGFQKIANRITTGLILASLIVGASLLMDVQTSFQIFGYPGLAILFFLIAAGVGLWLVFNILITDQKQNSKNGKSRNSS